MRKRMGSWAALALLVVTAACGGDNKVGDESLLNFKDQTQERLGATTTTAAPVATTAPPTTVAGGKAGIGGGATTSTTAAATTTTAAPSFEIRILGDQAGTSQFDPSVAQVPVGMVVRWVNRDTVPRSVEGDRNEFRSPAIAPGETFTYTPRKAGRINYHDGTRPYAVAALEVVSR